MSKASSLTPTLKPKTEEEAFHSEAWGFLTILLTPTSESFDFQLVCDLVLVQLIGLCLVPDS